MEIRKLEVRDAEAFVEVRRAALLDTPLAFTASPADDVASSSETIREQLHRQPDYVIFGAFDDRLVGVLGLMRERQIKARHKVRLSGMYVAPTHRQRGVAGLLVRAAIAHARELDGVSCVHLSVSDGTLAARRLYEKTGFEVWGSEPDALRYNGKSYVEHHMILQL